MRIKKGVKLLGLQPQMVLASQVVASAFLKITAASTTITSAVEGKHSAKSKHYRGLALDFRTRHLSPAAAELVRDEVAESLGPEFDVILHKSSGISNPGHLHVEWDPEHVEAS